MNMLKKVVIAFVVGFLLTVILSLAELNSVVIYLINVTVILIIIAYIPTFHPMYVSKNIERIEAFIQSSKNPTIQLFSALAKREDYKVEELILPLIEKYKGNQQGALFFSIYKCYKQQFDEELLEHINQIKSPLYRNYYKTIFFIECGDLDRALNLIRQMKDGWMKHALEAEFYKKSGNMEDATIMARKSLEKSRGLQRYLLFYEFKREFNL